MFTPSLFNNDKKASKVFATPFIIIVFTFTSNTSGYFFTKLPNHFIRQPLRCTKLCSLNQDFNKMNRMNKIIRRRGSYHQCLKMKK
jgi:hypothetical protein